MNSKVRRTRSILLGFVLAVGLAGSGPGLNMAAKAAEDSNNVKVNGEMNAQADGGSDTEITVPDATENTEHVEEDINESADEGASNVLTEDTENEDREEDTDGAVAEGNEDGEEDTDGTVAEENEETVEETVIEDTGASGTTEESAEEGTAETAEKEAEPESNEVLTEVENDTAKFFGTADNKKMLSRTVTFKVTNGSWNDGTKTAKTITLTGYEEDALKLSSSQIPAVGSKPNADFTAGSWNVTPNTNTVITKNTTYVYTYAREIITGWRTINKKRYYYTNNGEMVTGWKTISGKKYYFADSKWKGYTASKKGMRLTGWKTISGKQYYFADSRWKGYTSSQKGKMVTGRKTISGNKYYFEKTGALTNIRVPDAINAWGDSMTEGAGSSGLSYPDFLEKLTGIKTNNFGIGGNTSTEILNRSLKYGKQVNDVLVIQMGDNGCWNNLDTLIGQYKTLIKKSGSNRYIIFSSTDDPDDFDQIWGYTHNAIGLNDTWYEAKYKKVFGDHLCNGRKYLIQHGLEINNLKETEEDKRRAKKGNISLQLRNPWKDNTHLNEAGYKAMAYAVYEQGKILGYW